MLVTLAPQDLDICARTVKFLDKDGADNLGAALASALRNRFLLSCRSRKPTISRVCQDFLREATGEPPVELAPAATSDVAWCRAMAINCLVWSGDLADPTNGATSCHRHDLKAPWAARRSATALIGAYIFLR